MQAFGTLRDSFQPPANVTRIIHLAIPPHCIQNKMVLQCFAQDVVYAAVTLFVGDICAEVLCLICNLQGTPLGPDSRNTFPTGFWW